jgi:hypothetical protein
VVILGYSKAVRFDDGTCVAEGDNVAIVDLNNIKRFGKVSKLEFAKKMMLLDTMSNSDEDSVIEIVYLNLIKECTVMGEDDSILRAFRIRDNLEVLRNLITGIMEKKIDKETTEFCVDTMNNINELIDNVNTLIK